MALKQGNQATIDTVTDTKVYPQRLLVLSICLSHSCQNSFSYLRLPTNLLDTKLVPNAREATAATSFAVTKEIAFLDHQPFEP